MADRVQMEATAFGTTHGARGILHTDPRKEADHQARYPLVDEADAATLERLGLAKRMKGDAPTDDDAADAGLTVDERAGVMVSANADAEDSVDVPTGLSTRDSTAFEAPIETLTGAAAGNTVLVGDDAAVAAEETAPASGKKARASAAAS